MAITPPLLAAGPRSPQRPRPIPKPIRELIKLMVWGKTDDPDCAPQDFIAAARECGVNPDKARRWLDRGECRVLQRNERKAFRDLLCASNERALQRVRDKSANGMATVAAVRCLEQIDEASAMPGRVADQTTPHVTIHILSPAPRPAPAPMTIEAKPIAELDEHGRPVFDPARPYR
jgi:hypothetical protein